MQRPALWRDHSTHITQDKEWFGGKEKSGHEATWVRNGVILGCARGSGGQCPFINSQWRNVSIETVKGTGAGTSLRMKAILPFRKVTEMWGYISAIVFGKYGQKDQELKANLFYIVSSRPIWATWEPMEEKTKKERLIDFKSDHEDSQGVPGSPSLLKIFLLVKLKWQGLNILIYLNLLTLLIHGSFI